VPISVFEQGDLVRVELSIGYSNAALTGTNIVTDFLPAGLVYAAGSARASTGTHRTTNDYMVWARQEGQRIIFHDHNSKSRPDDIGTYYYYARVINPGTFTAEGSIVQNRDAMSYMTIGSDEVIVIREQNR